MAGDKRIDPTTRIEDRRYVDEVCKLGQGVDCCRYLLFDYIGFSCGKDTVFGDEVNRRIQRGVYKSVGDHCPGYLFRIAAGDVVFDRTPACNDGDHDRCKCLLAGQDPTYAGKLIAVNGRGGFDIIGNCACECHTKD